MNIGKTSMGNYVLLHSPFSTSGFGKRLRTLNPKPVDLGVNNS